MNNKRLYRSTTQKVFGGVAGGIAEYFDMDPVIIRIIFALAVIFGGGGILIYIVLWIAVPERPYTSTMFNQDPPPAPDPVPGNEPPNYTQPVSPDEIKKRRHNGSLIGGVILIGIGSLIMVSRVFPRIYFSDLWPFILVVVGVALILTSINQIKKDPA